MVFLKKDWKNNFLDNTRQQTKYRQYEFKTCSFLLMLFIK